MAREHQEDAMKQSKPLTPEQWRASWPLIELAARVKEFLQRKTS